MSSPLEETHTTHRIRTNGSATATEASNANQELLDYLASLVELRLAKPEDDLISKLVVEHVGFSSFSCPSIISLSAYCACP